MTISRNNLGRFTGFLRWQRHLRTAGFYYLVAALATAGQLALFIHLFIGYSKMLTWPLPPRWLVWSWVAALDIGITFACFGLFSARRWNERILALILLCLQFLSLLTLFRTGVFFYTALHDVPPVH